MEKTSVHFEPANVGAVEAHNERTQEYLESVKRSGRKLYFFQDLTHLNQSLVNPLYDGMTCAEIFEKQKSLYRKKFGQEPNLKDRIVTNKKTGKQKIISGWSPIRENVSPIKEDTKLTDFAPFVKWCEENGLKVIRIDLHFDEGYETVRGERTFNRHAHIVVDWMDWDTGKTAKLDAAKMSEAQDVMANALEMERGEKKVETGRVHLNPAEYREKKAEEIRIQLEAENEKLQKENETLRKTNTGLSAKFLDFWQYKGRAQKAESDLETERKAHSEEMEKANKTIEELKKESEIENERLARLRKDLFEKENSYKQEIERLSILVGKQKLQIRELTKGNEQQQTKGLGR